MLAGLCWQKTSFSIGHKCFCVWDIHVGGCSYSYVSFCYIFYTVICMCVLTGLCVRWVKQRRVSILGTCRFVLGLENADQNSWQSPPSTTTLW